MPNKFKIKRGSVAPTNSANIDNYELVYNYTDNELWTKHNGSVVKVSSGTNGTVTNVVAGNGLTGGGTTTATLDVGAGTGISVAANSVSTNDSQIVHDNLSGFVDDEHINHSGVSILAGTGLTGGGTIASSRTLNVVGENGLVASADAIGLDISTLTSIVAANVEDEDLLALEVALNGAIRKIALSDLKTYTQVITSVSGMTNNNLLTASGSTTISGESGLTYDTSTLAVTGDQTLSGVLKHSSNGDNRLTLDDDSDSSNINQVTLAGANNVNILIDGTNNGTGDFQIRSRPTTANDLDTADIIVDIDETTATFDNITSQQFQIGSANRFKILETGAFVQSGSLGVGLTPIGDNARIQATSHIEAGVGSGAIGLTINDGGGNSNVTFNHTGRVPEQNGNSGRIEVNTDGIGNQYMAFELAGNVTSGVTVATTEIARINSTGLQSSLSGTAASPALRVNDSDTGLYRIADNKLGISTAGTFAVAVDASQNVGIGTSTPGYKLDVVGTSRTDALIIDGGGTYAAGSIYSDSNWGMLFRAKQASPGQAEFRWANSADSELMRIDSSGTLTIGGTSPLTTGGTPLLSIRGGSYGLNFGAGTNDMSYIRRIDTGDYQWQTWNGSNDGEIHLQPYGGSVGIGTASPSGKLEISNDVGHAQNTVLVIKSDDSDGDQGASSTADIDFHIWDSNTRLSTPQARIGVVGDGTPSQHSEAGGRLAFYTNVESYSSPSLTERMRIDSSGNVGIGNNSPADK